MCSSGNSASTNPSTSTSGVSGPSQSAASGAAAGQAASSASKSAGPSSKGGCSSPIVVNVNQTTSQTISNAPAPYAAWNGTYSWTSKYKIEINKSNKTIRVSSKLKVNGTITEAQKTGWKSALETEWNNKAKISCNSGSDTTVYPVTIDVGFVNSGEDYAVTANGAGAQEGGRSGRGGTTSMTGWGVADTVDICHEFGHMLGNTDEYFTCNGVNFSSGGNAFRNPTGGVMNNPSNNPKLSNYTLIKNKVQTALGAGVSCTVVGP
jgi:hypothetical protein